MDCGQEQACFRLFFAAFVILGAAPSPLLGQGFPMPRVGNVVLSRPEYRIASSESRLAPAEEKAVHDETNNDSSAEVEREPLPVPVPRINGFAGEYRSAGCGDAVSAGNRTALCARCGLDEATLCCCENGKWRNARPIDFSRFGQGEYIGPHRNNHVTQYRLRVDDRLNLVYRLTRELTVDEYRFEVGDELRVERESLNTDSANNDGFDRTLTVLPDGLITLPLIGQIRAAGKSVQELREEIERKSKKLYTVALWTVTPTRVEARLQDLRNSVDARQGVGGQAISLVVSPDGTIQPPGVGSVCVQGMSLDEAKMEVDQRYADAGFRGIEVTPVLTQRAPRFVYVFGEVKQAGRFELQGPTTAMQAIALAGGWNVGGKLRQIVIFRRADDWRLVATQLNLRGALYGHHPTPADEIFLRDSDIVMIPKNPIRQANDAINQLFTQGANDLLLFGSAIGIFQLSLL